jgi:hypothetical protein
VLGSGSCAFLRVLVIVVYSERRASAEGPGAASHGARGRAEVTAGRSRNVIRIAITQAAFDAIASTLALGSVGYENEVNEQVKGWCGFHPP